MRSLKLTHHTLVSGLAYSILFAPFATWAAGPGGSEEKFPDYFPAHTVIKCPYLPPGLTPATTPLCDGVYPTCVGTDGPDLILGTEKNDVIVGRGGNDTIHGDAGHDTICGGPGNDSVLGARGADTIFGEEGDDFLFGAPEGDTLDGGPGDYDVLWGGPGVDKLNGGPGDFDVCMLQREMGEYDAEGCNTVYPPPGYVHDEEPDPGVLRAQEPLKLR
ncbi:MAG: calcium-binding protein [Pseudomonadota bacterium]|nr:calcium-binding protein [Pseudomonadota bacterium]